MRSFMWCTFASLWVACGNGGESIVAIAIERDGTGNGTVASLDGELDCGERCRATVPRNEPIELVATPADGSVFVGWGDPCSGTGPCELVPHEALAVRATFEATHALRVTRDGDGDGTVTSQPAGIACGAACEAPFQVGTVVVLSAAASEGSMFAGWSGGGCSGTGTCSVTLDAATTVTATFIKRGVYYTLEDSGGETLRFQHIEPTSAAVTNVGTFNAHYYSGDCAWHGAANQLFVTTGRYSSERNLYTVNVATGAATLVGAHGVADTYALAYHTPSDTLYTIGGSALYRLNATTGAATLVGNIPITANWIAMVWDPVRARMVAMSNLHGCHLFAINLATAEVLLLGTCGLQGDAGMTYDPIIDRYVIADRTGNLDHIDPGSFARTQVATGRGAHTCVAYRPGR